MTLLYIDSDQDIGENVNKKIIIRRVITFLSICFLMGCTQKQPEKSMIQEKDRAYQKEFHDCGITMNANVQDDLLVLGDRVYFSVFEKGNGVDFKVGYFSGNIFEDELFWDLGIETDYQYNIGFEVSSSVYSEQNCVNVLFEDDVLGQIRIQKYDEKGSILDTVVLSDDNINGCVDSFKIRSDGKIYLSTGNGVYAYSDENGIVEYDFPEKALLVEMFLKNDKIACVFRMTKDDGTSCLNLMIYNDQGHVETTIEVPLYSDAFVTHDNEVFFYCDQCIYKINDSFDGYEMKMDLRDVGEPFYKSIYAIIKKDGEYGIVYKSLSDDAIRSVIFHESKEVKQQKKEITVYDPAGMMDAYVTDQMILAFNEMNQEYYVTKKEYERDFNYVLISDDKPDLIFLNELGVGSLGHIGYLEDLTAFLEKDSRKNEFGLINNLSDKLQIDGKLYSLPRTIGFESLCGYSTRIGTEIGWSENQFVQWFLDRPDALKESWMGRLEILRFCLEGSLDNYVDFENKKSKLDGESFRLLLQKINQITEYSREGLMKTITGDVMDLFFETVDDLAFWNRGEPITLKGFPNKDATENYILTYNGLSMMNTSDNKEGAYEFIKFVQEYRYGYTCYFYTLNAKLEKMFEIRTRENSSKAEYKTAEREFWQLYLNSRPRDLNSVPVISIILEEAGAYFEGDKSLEEVSSVIHGRVQLWLDERK